MGQTPIIFYISYFSVRQLQSVTLLHHCGNALKKENVSVKRSRIILDRVPHSNVPLQLFELTYHCYGIFWGYSRVLWVATVSPLPSQKGHKNLQGQRVIPASAAGWSILAALIWNSGGIGTKKSRLKDPTSLKAKILPLTKFWKVVGQKTKFTTGITRCNYSRVSRDWWGI